MGGSISCRAGFLLGCRTASVGLHREAGKSQRGYGRNFDECLRITPNAGIARVTRPVPWSPCDPLSQREFLIALTLAVTAALLVTGVPSRFFNLLASEEGFDLSAYVLVRLLRQGIAQKRLRAFGPVGDSPRR